MLDGTSRNVSVGGLLIDSTLPPPAVGDAVDVEVRLPGVGLRRLAAVVRWTVQGGVGVQLGSLRASEVRALNLLLARERRACQSVASRAEPTAVEAVGSERGYDRAGDGDGHDADEHGERVRHVRR